jgi:hypothetical protein
VSLIALVIWLVIIGVALYLINAYVPMAAPIKTILNVVVVVATCLWLISVFGVADISVPRVGR